MLKRTIVFLMLLGSFTYYGSAYAANVNVTLTIGQTVAWVGEQISNLAIAPYEKNGVTYVPFRFVGEALGARVEWDEKNKGVTFSTTQHIIKLYVDSNKIINDGKEEFVSSKPLLNGNYVVIPLRLVSELLGYLVDYNPLGRVITIKVSQPPIAQFDIVTTNVIIGQPVQYYEYSYNPNGAAIVDWQWQGKKDIFDKAGTYTINLRVKDVNAVWSPWTSRTLTVNDIPNNPPQASFTVGNTTVAQGQTITYAENSFDPDGDKIVNWQWTGKSEAFFKPGDHNVTLKVKDEKGKWSDPYTVTIHVSDEVILNEFKYNLANPVSGNIFPFIGMGDKDFKNIIPRVTNDSDVTLFFSNSPEKVATNGILYADTIGGHVRLMYHHRNTSNTRKRFYLIARNTSEKEVFLKYLKGGYSGPSTDDVRVGQIGIMRYLQSYYDAEVVIPPHKWITLNIGSNELVPANQGESIYGLYEVQTSDKLKYMCIALDEGKNLEDALPNLPNLERDIHSRGTFENANRTLDVNVDSNTRFIIGDGVNDKFIMGYDALSNKVTQNQGNYGVIYNINITSPQSLVMFVNPRGGGFGGTFAVDGNYFYAPSNGGFAYNTIGMATMLNVIGRNSTMTFTPPASSNMPIYIDFLATR